MRFLVDECTGPSVARWLDAQQHDVFSVYAEARGMDDDEVIQRAVEDDRIIVTNDKDFGEKIYQDQKQHKGVVLLRLEDERFAVKIAVLGQLLENYADQLENQFIVASEKSVRIARA